MFPAVLYREHASRSSAPSLLFWLIYYIITCWNVVHVSFSLLWHCEVVQLELNLHFHCMVHVALSLLHMFDVEHQQEQSSSELDTATRIFYAFSKCGNKSTLE